MAKRRFLVTGYGLRILVLSYLIGLLLIMFSIGSFSKNILSYSKIILFSVGFIMLISIVLISLKLDKIPKTTLLVVFILYLFILPGGYSYFFAKIIFLLIVIIIASLYINRNLPSIDKREEELAKAAKPSNPVYAFFGLREIKK